MVFAHFFLRPAAQALEPPQRVRLMHDVLQRFLRQSLPPWCWCWAAACG